MSNNENVKDKCINGREWISGKKIKERKMYRILAIENHLPQKKKDTYYSRVFVSLSKMINLKGNYHDLVLQTRYTFR